MTDQLIPHLFRTEYGKLVAAISRYFGLDQMEMAEDVASNAFMKAMESWPYHGVPKEPVGWLYAVARNEMLNVLKRNKNGQKIYQKESEAFSELSPFEFQESIITDSQLRLLFALCHPSISSESQISLALKTLCGLGIEEIATAFLTNRETVNKRLVRARQRLRDGKISLEISEAEITERLPAVLHTIYLLFSEGYYSENHEIAVRPELCVEALNLGYLLLQLPQTSTHETYSLMALMCFQASRLEARKRDTGADVLYHDQDPSFWDQDLIQKGFELLQKAASHEPCPYYIEASVAFWYCQPESAINKWENILRLYDLMIIKDTSPIVALNRLYAVYQVEGAEVAYTEALSLNITSSHFYYLLLAELIKSTDKTLSLHYLHQAHSLCRAKHEKNLIEHKIDELDGI